MEKRFSCTNNFEAVYLRQAMIKRIKNPATEKELKKYHEVISRTVYLFFSRYYVNFSKISMEIEDVRSIANMYAYTFLSTYNTKEYFDKYKDFDQANIDRKHRNNLIKFLKHKLTYLHKVAGAKSNRILGEKTTTFYLEIPEGKFYNLPAGTLLQEYKRLGYKRITKAQYKNRKPEDRYIEVYQPNNSFLSVEDGWSDTYFNNTNGSNKLNGLDAFSSDQTVFVNENPYTSTTEDLLLIQEKEIEISKKMNDPDFIRKVLKTNIRYNRKMYTMLKERLQELESLGNIDV